MFEWAIGGLGALFGFVGSTVGAVAGWAWEEVTAGIYTWLANGLALLIEWVWSVLDSGTTPHVTEDWFQNELAAQLGVIGLAVTIAMMLASAAQAALAGRPEQIGDALKQGVHAIVASALTLTVLDVTIGIVDEASGAVWRTGRADLVAMLERVVVVATTTRPLGSTFIGPLCLLFGFVGLVGLVVALMMRSALIYVAAALAPVVWSANVLPLFRGSARKLVHLIVALVVSKLAIVITLVVAVKLIANPAGDPSSPSPINDGAAAVGTLMTGFVCFLVAAVTPVVLYRLMPTVEAAAVGAGVAGGWARSATSAAQTALMVKSLGASAATRPVAGQSGAPGAAKPGAIAGLTGTIARSQPSERSPIATTTLDPDRSGADGPAAPSRPQSSTQTSAASDRRPLRRRPNANRDHTDAKDEP
jgi:hypothetical protein